MDIQINIDPAMMPYLIVALVLCIIGIFTWFEYVR